MATIVTKFEFQTMAADTVVSEEKIFKYIFA